MPSTQTAPKAPRARPLSPHLEIYRFTLTMAMSIVHRITGVGLYLGVLLLAWFLISASADAAAFAVFSGFIHSIIGRLILFGFTWALIHHMLGGLRHFVWEAGYGLEDPGREQLAQATLIGGIALTVDHLDHRLRRTLNGTRQFSMKTSPFRTPLGRVRCLGSAHLGQRRIVAAAPDRARACAADVRLRLAPALTPAQGL